MKFEENFNLTCNFPDYTETLPDILKEAERETKQLNEEYDKFKKEHNLENLYFSKVVHVECIDSNIMEVYYAITDLYLTYLDANGMYPEGTTLETFLIKEQYLYNTPKEWLFRDSMLAAIERQDMFKRTGDCKTCNSSMFVGVTERIKLSEPSNGLPGIIIDRVPMTYKDLVEK